MLEDRDYMRARSRRIPWSATTVLICILVAVFVLQSINRAYLHTDAEFWLALTPYCFLRGWLWQLITFQFLHAGIWHLVGNLIVFWWVGRFVEHILGKQRFLVAMFGCGAIGGILQEVLMLLFPEHYGEVVNGVFIGIPVVVGASAGVAGLFAIFALLERNSYVYLWFVLPIRAIYLLWGALAISLFFTIVPMAGGNIAHAAHLGGLLAGMAWVKLGWHRDYVKLPWEGLLGRWQQWHPFKEHRRKREFTKATSAKFAKWPRAEKEKNPEAPSEEFISREVDPILDKISEHGIQSLTEHERRILEAARSKMAKK